MFVAYILASSLIASYGPQASPAKVVGILAPQPMATHPSAGREVSPKDTQITVEGKTYWICQEGEFAVLIDPDALNAKFTNQLIADLVRARQALNQREADFSIVRSCPALLDLVLRTIDRKSTGGLGDVTMIPQLTLTLQKEGGAPTDFAVTPAEEHSPSPVRLTPFDIGNIPDNPQATPILPHQYAVSYFEITPSAKRRTLEEKLIRQYWDTRYEMDRRYRDVYQDLTVKLTLPVQYSGLISQWKGKPVEEFTGDDRSILTNILQRYNEKIEDWQTAKVTKVTARLTLSYLNLRTDGNSHNTTFRLPTGLY